MKNRGWSHPRGWITLLCCAVMALFTGSAQAEEGEQVDSTARSAVLIERETGKVLLSCNSREKLPMASTTKVMTALIALEYGKLDEIVTVGRNAYGVPGTSIYLNLGEKITLRDLLYGLMLQSGNDAAMALAIYCGGTVEGFAEMMNDKARILGLENSHFVNPSGLDDPNHYSTARDLAHLAAYAMQNPIFRQTVSTKTVSAGNRRLTNHNKLLWRVDGADGIKTGYTRAAGRILVSSAVQKGRRLIAVTIQAPNDWNDHKQLFQNGFANYAEVNLVTEGDCLGYAALIGGETQTVPLIAAESFHFSIASWEKPELVVKETQMHYAPVAFGQNAGTAYVCIDGKTVGRIQLVYGETVELCKESKKSIWDKLFGSE